MKVLIVTVAGLSSRFGQSLGYSCLKCLYHGQDNKNSMLYRLVNMYDFDRYIIVGGYQYEELVKAIEEDLGEKRDKILLVENTKYAEYGSGYSLYLGLKEALKLEFSEIVFAEGDLLVDCKTFKEVCEASTDILTVNRDPILANKAVACYSDMNNKIHYIYDTNHTYLEIGEPFTAIYNSGQIWKFAQPELLRKVTTSISEEAWKGTNLVLIQSYFGESEDTEVITFKKWVNCNTVQDYENGIAEIKEYEDIKRKA